EDDKKEAKTSLPENTQRNEWKIYSISKRNISEKEGDPYEQRKETNLRKRNRYNSISRSDRSNFWL
ncbi:5115_t:CDS:1, partial [Scutellospora calospora]